MTIDERVKLYTLKFKECRAVEPVKQLIEDGFYEKVGLDALEAIRELNTILSELYNVPVPVLTVWVRDDNYVSATKEIYLGEPELEGFLHQFRHHLQNIERDPNRRGLTAEGWNGLLFKIPYENTMYRMYGEDDARAWAKWVIELAVK